MPTDTLVLSCENWYSVECKRLQDDQAAGQGQQFSFIEPLLETYFSDVVVKSASGLDYALHATILRRSGFECSMCTDTSSISMSSQKSAHIASEFLNQTSISVTITPSGDYDQQQKLLPLIKLSPIYLHEPCDFQTLSASKESILGAVRSHHYNNSFNCLSNGNTKNRNVREGVPVDNSMGLLDVENGGMRRSPSTSNSDSHLETSQVLLPRFNGATSINTFAQWHS